MAEVILFVCTGNTCRSPMAEGLARQILSEMAGGESGCSTESKWVVESAGTACFGGGSAAQEAVEALRRRGVDISDHCSRSLTKEMVDRARVIYAMAQHHVDAILDFDRGATAKTHLLDAEGGEIADPIGMGQVVYDETAARLEELIGVRLAELTKVRTAKGSP